MCRSPMLLSSSTISCITPAGEGAELDVQVSIDGINIKGTTQFTFAYALPQVSTISRYVQKLSLGWITPHRVCTYGCTYTVGYFSRKLYSMLDLGTDSRLFFLPLSPQEMALA